MLVRDALQTAELSNHIQPYTNGEIIFVIMLQLMGAIVFGFIIGTVGTILMSWGLLEEKISRKMAELREFMNEKHVPKSTRKKVKKFMEEYYRAKAGYDESEVVSALPPAIALELLDSIYRGALLKVPIFKDLDDDVICRICLLMKPLHIAKGRLGATPALLRTQNGNCAQNHLKTGLPQLRTCVRNYWISQASNNARG